MFRNKAEAAAWLSGVIDGEGSIGKRAVKGTKGFARDVRVTNTDLALLAAVEEALDMLGIPWTRYDRSERKRLGTKPIFDIVVSHRKNLVPLSKVLTLRSVKAAQLDEMIGSYLRIPKRPPMETLEFLMASGKTDAEIGEKYGVTPGAVWFWRKHYGLVRG